MNVVFITFIISIIRYEIVVKRIHIYSLTSCGKNANLKSGSELNKVIKIRLKKKNKTKFSLLKTKKRVYCITKMLFWKWIQKNYFFSMKFVSEKMKFAREKNEICQWKKWNLSGNKWNFPVKKIKFARE